MLCNEAMHKEIGYVSESCSVEKCLKAVEEYKVSDIPVVNVVSVAKNRSY
jgi:predicted transcriptional regulator